MACHLRHEIALRRSGYARVAGIDEAGRGPIAGPVVAAAVVLPARFRGADLDDSKRLAPRKRERLFEQITADARIDWACGIASVEEIEERNILQATWLAMRRAVDALREPAQAVLIDGLEVSGFPLPQTALVGGDGISLSIAAASIVAKVTRDRMMRELAVRFPGYGFERHNGYPTKSHLECLQRHGPCPIHRKTFQPVAQLSLEL